MKLKRLGFGRDIAINVVMYLSNLYIYAKHSSPAFRSAAASLERIVQPLSDNLKPIPARLLVILDNKVDQGLNKFNEHAPASAKWTIDKARLVTQRTSLVAKTIVHKAQTDGPSVAICYSSHIFTQLLLILLAYFWYLINKIMVLHVVAQMAIPTVVYWSEAYNEKLKEMIGKGYVVFNYLPRVPWEEIAKAYKQVEAERGPVCTLCD